MEMMTTSKEMAMAAVRETPVRHWRGSNTAHAVPAGTFQGRTVPFAARIDLCIDDRVSALAVTPITGVVYPRLEAPPV
ncbi:MAG: hypothetical protein ABIU87_05195 [Ornithinibacter sp.]